MAVLAGLWWGASAGGWVEDAAWARSTTKGHSARPLTPRPPKLPFHKDRVCRRDKDCVFRPTICPGCNPSKPIWRQVCNRKTARRIRAMQNRVRCAMPRCRRGAHSQNWIGSVPVCFQKQCTVAPLRPKKQPRSADLKCMRNHDCAFYPAPRCVCLPCGLYWRQAANRRAIRRAKSILARIGACRAPRCKKCRRRALGKKALCIRGRCTAR